MNYTMPDGTTIIISKTRDILKQVGHKGQSYDSIGSELLIQSGRDGNVEKGSLIPNSPVKDQTASLMQVVEGEP